MSVRSSSKFLLDDRGHGEDIVVGERRAIAGLERLARGVEVERGNLGLILAGA